MLSAGLALWRVVMIEDKGDLKVALKFSGFLVVVCILENKAAM